MEKKRVQVDSVLFSKKKNDIIGKEHMNEILIEREAMNAIMRRRVLGSMKRTRHLKRSEEDSELLNQIDQLSQQKKHQYEKIQEMQSNFSQTIQDKIQKKIAELFADLDFSFDIEEDYSLDDDSQTDMSMFDDFFEKMFSSKQRREKTASSAHTANSSKSGIASSRQKFKQELNTAQISELIENIDFEEDIKQEQTEQKQETRAKFSAQKTRANKLQELKTKKDKLSIEQKLTRGGLSSIDLNGRGLSERMSSSVEFGFDQNSDDGAVGFEENMQFGDNRLAVLDFSDEASGIQDQSKLYDTSETIEEFYNSLFKSPQNGIADKTRGGESFGLKSRLDRLLLMHLDNKNNPCNLIDGVALNQNQINDCVTGSLLDRSANNIHSGQTQFEQNLQNRMDLGGNSKDRLKNLASNPLGLTPEVLNQSGIDDFEGSQNNSHIGTQGLNGQNIGTTRLEKFAATQSEGIAEIGSTLFLDGEWSIDEKTRTQLTNILKDKGINRNLDDYLYEELFDQSRLDKIASLIMKNINPEKLQNLNSEELVDLASDYVNKLEASRKIGLKNYQEATEGSTNLDADESEKDLDKKILFELKVRTLNHLWDIISERVYNFKIKDIQEYLDYRYSQSIAKQPAQLENFQLTDVEWVNCDSEEEMSKFLKWVEVKKENDPDFAEISSSSHEAEHNLTSTQSNFQERTRQEINHFTSKQEVINAKETLNGNRVFDLEKLNQELLQKGLESSQLQNMKIKERLQVYINQYNGSLNNILKGRGMEIIKNTSKKIGIHLDYEVEEQPSYNAMNDSDFSMLKFANILDQLNNVFKKKKLIMNSPSQMLTYKISPNPNMRIERIFSNFQHKVTHDGIEEALRDLMKSVPYEFVLAPFDNIIASVKTMIIKDDTSLERVTYKREFTRFLATYNRYQYLNLQNKWYKRILLSIFSRLMKYIK